MIHGTLASLSKNKKNRDPGLRINTGKKRAKGRKNKYPTSASNSDKRQNILDKIFKFFVRIRIATFLIIELLLQKERNYCRFIPVWMVNFWINGVQINKAWFYSQKNTDKRKDHGGNLSRKMQN